MKLSHDYSDLSAALNIDLTPQELVADARAAVAALDQIEGFLMAVSQQPGEYSEDECSDWQEQAQTAAGVSDRLRFEFFEDYIPATDG